LSHDPRRGVKRTYEGEGLGGFPVVELNVIDQKTSFVPVSSIEKLLGEIKTAAEI
jgi:hypothetical protein